MGGERKEEFKQELLNASVRNILTPKPTRSHGYVVVLRLNLFLCKKEEDREGREGCK